MKHQEIACWLRGSATSAACGSPVWARDSAPTTLDAGQGSRSPVRGVDHVGSLTVTVGCRGPLKVTARPGRPGNWLRPVMVQQHLQSSGR